ncbi:MAG: DUF2334 domain-containing protein [Clostridiales bacterium]|nr:DUF2334 domain-containing protein [Clostridiales bacterium]
MMYKVQSVALVLAVVLLAACLLPSAACAEVQRILVLADTQADRVSEANLAELRRFMAYSALRCDYADAWREVTLDGYDAVIVVVAEDRAINEQTAYALRTGERPVFVVGSGALEQLARTVQVNGSIVVRCETESGSTSELLLSQSEMILLEGEGAAIGGTLYVESQTYPLCKTLGHVTQMAYCDAQEPLMAAALANYLQAWMWPYQNDPISYGQYLVLDNVYPFYEPEDLMAITDMLREEGVPYAVCVMPVYDNADYPSMKRFCEWLRYIQSTGAGIVLHAPLVSLEMVDMTQYMKQLNTAYSAYTRYGVYPLAIEAPEAYLFSKRGLEAIAGFRTVLLFRSDDHLSDRAEGENLAWYDGHQVLAPCMQDGGALTTAYAQAIYLDVNEDVDTLRRYVQTLKRSRRALKSLVDMDNAVYMGSDYVFRSATGVVEVNGEIVSLAYEPFEYEDYKFDRGFEQYLTNQILTSNRHIMTFVLVASTVFIAAILLSRRAMRWDILHRKHYKPASVGKGKHRPTPKERGLNEPD